MCSIGKMPDVSSACTTKPFKRKQDFSVSDWVLLRYRSGCPRLKTICRNHEIIYLKTFLNRNKFCCDPKSLHKPANRKSLKRISLSLSMKSIGSLNLVPGKGLCLPCYQVICTDLGNIITPPFPTGDESDADKDDGDTEDSNDSNDSSEERHEVWKVADDTEWPENPYVSRENSAELGFVAESRVSSPNVEAVVPCDLHISSPSVCLAENEVPRCSEISNTSAHSPTVPTDPSSRVDKSSPALPSSQQSGSGSSFSSGGEVGLEKLNAFLTYQKLSPIQKRHAQRQPSTRPTKLAKVLHASKGLLEKIVEGEVREPGHDSEFQEIIDQLKARFLTCNSRQEKVYVLSVLPQSWSINKVAEEFNVSFGFARFVRELVKLKGILPLLSESPRGSRLSAEVIEKVIRFYEEDEVNVYIMPDKNQFLSITINGVKVQKQKRLLLANLKELYIYFSERNPNLIGFSSFAALRPKYCLLAGSPGTHCVCVCQRHENIKLMIEGANLKLFSSTEEGSMKNYKQCLATIRCEPPTEQCFLNQCNECPGLESMQEILEVHFDAELIDDVTYNSWVSSSSDTRCTLLTVIKPKEEFIECFLKDLSDLKEHDFIAFQQRKYLQYLKDNLPVGDAVVLLDFAENYRMIIQNEVQGYHWTTTEATIHPFVAYYRDEEKEELKHFNMVIISDTKSHTAVTIFAFQKHFINFLKAHVMGIKKIHYFSDSTTSQYRNRNAFCNLCHHLEDFGIEAEWNYFETAHGKSPCDSLGGIIKRCAAKASLQGTLIRSAEELFTWARNKWSEESKVKVHYVSSEEINMEFTNFLKQRLAKTIPVPQTMAVHHVLPLSTKRLQLKKFSLSSSVWTASILK
ncbi:ARL14 effector protein [Frankliniella fusca]|uniref:ARL14 effector protein n=1 Tax=Frankliniella fusca TaxID=407009 RepID=A0AAE1L5U9_9NEOP|nr:ARL14 effector protein [Frankliniella fusca]